MWQLAEEKETLYPHWLMRWQIAAKRADETISNKCAEQHDKLRTPGGQKRNCCDWNTLLCLKVILYISTDAYSPFWQTKSLLFYHYKWVQQGKKNHTSNLKFENIVLQIFFHIRMYVFCFSLIAERTKTLLDAGIIRFRQETYLIVKMHCVCHKNCHYRDFCKCWYKFS